MLLLKIIFFLSLFCIFHSYVLYPFIIRSLSLNKKPNQILYPHDSSLPLVSIMVAIYNEEKVIEEKLMTLLKSNYPKGKIQIYVGSDCSSDRSNEIVGNLAKAYDNLHFFAFEDRSGKPGVLNKLSRIIFEKQAKASDHLLLMTDANVMLEKDTIFHLAKHFKNTEIAIVDANMTNVGEQKEGISRSEKTYISSEVLLKNREGIAKGKMIGPFGGCYILRSDYFEEIPSNYLVDDFFIAMKTLEKGGKAINELEAICYEALSHDPKEEYKRKSRISAGNFQNLNHFKHLLWPPIDTLAFRFLSHKVLRWLGPFFIIFALLTSGILALLGNFNFLILFVILLGILLLPPLLDSILKSLGINVLLLRNISYFLFMNLALLEGFFKYTNGIKNNVWQPSERQ